MLGAFSILVFALQIYGASMPSQAEQFAQVGCQIRATKNDGGNRLEAVISGTGPVAGNYTFTVTPQDGGQPLKSESGEFKIEKSEKTVLNQSGVDVPSGKGFNASLSVTWPNGASSCSASVS
jgi:hypothetical protein